MSNFFPNEDSRSSIDMNMNDDDRMDDDLDDERVDPPLNRPKVNIVPTRDPLVAALFGSVVVPRVENAAEQECSLMS